jgi:CheY-like chemotaxis protein
VDTAEDGRAAVDRFLSEPEGTYQLILMDIVMPKMNGYDATKEIRASSHPQAKSIPIVAMTANAFKEDVSQALMAGMNNHISKPIDVERLFEVIGESMQQS